MVHAMHHRVYFAPGMFGFGRLTSFDYFEHVERSIAGRLEAQGHSVETYVADLPPTASIRRRAAALAERVARSAEGEHDASGPIHLVGHSTGGLDARLLASPGVDLDVPPETLAWLPRLASVTTMNTPHLGTPLASFFATVSGQRMLYAVTALTIVGLTAGAPPLAVASTLVVALGRLDRAVGLSDRIVDRSTESLLRVLDDARSGEVREYLAALRHDQGAILQLAPEAMDVFRAAVHDRPGVSYGCTVSMAPPPSAAHLARNLLTPLAPWRALSASLFSTLYGLTARSDDRYPCAAKSVEPAAARELERAFGRVPGARANDGVVPILSQLHGALLWTGHADHLDVLGHFEPPGSAAAKVKAARADWLRSGSEFSHARFDALSDAVTRHLAEAGNRLQSRS